MRNFIYENASHEEKTLDQQKVLGERIKPFTNFFKEQEVTFAYKTYEYRGVGQDLYVLFLVFSISKLLRKQ